MGVKCEICGINNAEFKDYRILGGDHYNKYYVCPECGLLNDAWFCKLKFATESKDKKRILAQIIGEVSNEPNNSL